MSAAPLANCRVLVTRPLDQVQALSTLLSQEQAIPINKPLIEIGPPEDFQPLDEAVRQLPSFDWIIFASTNAVNAFFERAGALNYKLDWGRTRVAVIGSATAAAAKERGLEIDFCPDSFVAEAFIEQFPGFPKHVRGVRFLWPKTDIGRPYISDRLTAAGAQVERVICYTTNLPHNSENLAQELRALLEFNGVDIVTFASSQAVRNFSTLISSVSPDPERLMKGALYAVIGPETAHTGRKLLPHVDIIARQHTIEGLVREMRAYAEASKLRFSARNRDN
ncbi:MAG: uroporphyrinogen-III synthase [Candidatus Obscuribacterales bacterium]